MKIYLLKKALFFLIVTTYLTACGGGGGGSSSGGSAGASDSSTAEPEETIEPVDITEENVDSQGESEVRPDPVSTKDLVVTEEFELRSTGPLLVEVSIPELQYTRSYVNICRKNESGTGLDYNSCLLNTPLKNGELSVELLLGNETNSLDMEVWQYDPAIQPLAFEWTREGGMVWRVR